MAFLCRFLIAFVATLFLIQQALGGKVVYSARERLPADWKVSLESNLNANDKFTLRIALHPKNSAELERRLLDISVPGKPQFRKYLNKQQITEIVGRSDSEIQRIRDFLATKDVKIDSVHPNRDWIFVTASKAQIEEIFECELASYSNAKTGAKKVGAKSSYTIPAEISDLVNFVAGMTTFSFGHWQVASTTMSAATAAVTPQTIYDNYQVPTTGSHGSKLGSQAVVEFGKAANFNTADLQTFFTNLQPSLKGEVCGVVEGTNNGDARPSVEANLDVQYIMAAGVFVNTTDYKITSGGNIEDEFLDYTILVNSQNQPPLVHSISYGEYGGSYDNTTDQQFSYELQKMGIAGVSVLLASGDNGVGCNTAGTSQEFDYPSSPYITMVGATYIDAATKKEVGATLSSGGFSKDFMQASWQADAVNGYFKTNPKLPSEDYYAPGRAYPDIAAYGQNVQVVASGKTEAVSGTSCSAPIFAGVVAAINHELLSAGQAPLGFLNPFLYANPQMFTDITEGSNPYEKCDGFQAAVGWDPVTGLGTPLYSEMLKAAFAAVGINKKI
jgi:tripeptidyl-peptidase-1